MTSTSGLSKGGASSVSSARLHAVAEERDLWSELLDATQTSQQQAEEEQGAEEETHVIVCGCGRFMEDVPYRLSPARDGDQDRPIPPGLSYSFFRDTDLLHAGGDGGVSGDREAGAGAGGVVAGKRLFHVWLLESPEYGWMLPRVLTPARFHKAFFVVCFDLSHPGSIYNTLCAWKETITAHVDDLFHDADLHVKQAMYTKHLEHCGEPVDFGARDVPESPFRALPVVLLGVERSRLSWTVKASNRIQLGKEADRGCVKFVTHVARQMSAAVISTRPPEAFERLLAYIKCRLQGVPWPAEDLTKKHPLDSMFLPASSHSGEPGAAQKEQQPLDTFLRFFEELLEAAPEFYTRDDLEEDVSAEQLVERYAQENLLESLVSMSAPRSNVSTPLHVREMPAEAAASVLQMGWLLEGATRSVSHAHDTSDLRYLGEQRRREQEQTQQQVQQGRGQEQNKQQSRAGAQGGGPAGSGASSSSGAGGAGAPKAAGTEESPEEFFTTILQRYPKRGGRSQGGGGSSSSSGKRTAGKSGSRS